jgi:tetratricopeptide (TPR) repeat protein/class 3 adenylate cyclase
MSRHLPPFILHNCEQGRFSGSFAGYVLFLDIADFTPISNVFRKEGKKGAEALSRFLSEVLGTPIDLVEKHGGFVSLFAGDAFCALFPEGDAANVKAVVNGITAFFAGHGPFVTEIGEFPVSVRLTVTSGEVEWRIFRNKWQNEYVFFGESLREMVELSHAKEPVALSEAVRTAFEIAREPVEKHLDYPFAPETVNAFLHYRLRGENPDNEIRDAAYCFIDLSRIEPFQQEATLTLLHDKLDAYGGFLNKLDATDKGLVALVLFGLPRAVGNTLDRACRFALEVVEAAPQLSFGLACGNTFAGFVGNESTREYTVLGAVVNLAARLMQKAQPKEILTDSFLYQEMHGHFHFEPLGAITMKGIPFPVKYHRLNRLVELRSFYQESEFVGRTDEIAWIREKLDTALANTENCVLYVSGDPGIGKSRLLREALSIYPGERFHRFVVTSDAVIQKPLEGIKQIVRTHFFYNPQLPKDAGIAMFRGLWAGIAGADPELKRIESIIASLLGYEWENSIWSVLPDKEKPSQLRNAFVTFMQAIATTKPVIIHLDDGQWLDEESREYLVALSAINVAPVHIIAACRYRDDGENVNLGLTGHRRFDLDLNTLSENGGGELIRFLLRVKTIPADTLRFILDKSMGNPLFIEQLTTYLMERGCLDEAANIVGEVGYISTFSIADIIGSRIDRLAENVRECLYNASVLGMEFNIRVLSQMLHGGEVTPELEDGKRNRIWKDLDELRYIFSHILIRDAAYNRMMSDKLKALHLLAAEAMEKVYEGDGKSRMGESIGYHFENAQRPETAALYYNQAGTYFTSVYEFAKAEALLKRSLELYHSNIGVETVEIADCRFHLGELYSAKGDAELALQYTKQAYESRLALLGQTHRDTIIAMNRLAISLEAMSQFQDAHVVISKALEISAEAYGDTDPLTIRTRHNLSNGYLHAKEYHQAEIQMRIVLDLRRSDPTVPKKLIAETLSDLGICLVYQDVEDDAEKCWDEALQVMESEVGQEHPDYCRILSNLATLDRMRGDFQSAEENFSLCIQFSRKLFGETHPRTIEFYRDIANVFYMKEDYTEALEYMETAYRNGLITYTPMSTPIASIMNDLANICGDMGQTDKAQELYRKSLDIKRQIWGEKHINTVMQVENIGLTYLSAKQYEEAITYLQQALEIRRTHYGESHSEVAKSYDALANVFDEMKKYDEAFAYSQKSLEIARAVFKDNDYRLTSPLVNASAVLEHLGRTDEAVALLEEAYAICKQTGGIEHPRTRSVITGMINLYTALNQPEKIAEYRALLAEAEKNEE